MCGITGFYDSLGQHSASAREIANDMAHAINHRGPDDSGVWISDDERLLLAHQRLSIIDVSTAGHQPMTSSSGRYTIVYNGEIYNYLEIKQFLNQTALKSESDTEIFLEAIEQWGLIDALKKCDGMFAFALWDSHLNQLSLVRDRIGEKPLYYGWSNEIFFFSSELKSLKKHPCFSSAVSMKAVTLYFNHGYIPAPYSIYQDIYKLMPGTVLTIHLEPSTFKLTSVKEYWSADNSTIDKCQGENVHKDYLSELDEKLTSVIEDEAIADVPLGSFLSGGIDSSIITAILQRNSERKVQTFSLGFNEKKYNEAQYAKNIANYLGTDHHELIVNVNDLQSVIPKLSTMYDEPFGDPSAIPTFLVSQFSRQSVTVALTGDGGDELFGGYNHYHRSAQIWSHLKKMPYPVRSLAATTFYPVARKYYHTLLGRKLERLSNYLMCKSMFDCYKTQTQASAIELSALLSSFDGENLDFVTTSLNGYSAMMYADSKMYLPDDILVKVDRASMAVSLETRAPFLNHKIVEFASSLPLKYKIHNGGGKIILKNLLNKYIPEKFYDRPKMGFGVPIDDWLRGALRDWVEDLLSENNLKKVGFLNVELIRHRWFQHKKEIYDWHYFLWDLLMFLEWYKLEIE